MFDRLIEWVIDFVDLFRFWEVIQPYQQATVTTLGKWTRVITPGPHLIWPFGVDYVVVDNVKPMVTRCGVQTLTTSDNKRVSLHAVISWHITNIERSVMNVEDLDRSLIDCVAGYVGESVLDNTWDYVRSPEFRSTLRTFVQTQGREWGVRVSRVQLRDCATSSALRILKDDGPEEIDDEE